MNENPNEKTQASGLTIEDVYRRRQEIVSDPTSFAQIITRFAAGGLGACVYSKDISVAVLALCWEYDEFKFVCPECGDTAYIYRFAGHVGPGGYWKLTAYCPKCNKHLYYHGGGFNPVKIHWAVLKRIETEVQEVCVVKNQTLEQKDK